MLTAEDMLTWLESHALCVGVDRDIDGEPVWEVFHDAGESSGRTLREAVGAAMAQGGGDADG